MNIVLLTLFDILQLLAKLESIDPEHIAPLSPTSLRSAHISMPILQCTNTHKEILIDIANTVLTSWPKLLDAVFGRLGK